MREDNKLPKFPIGQWGTESFPAFPICIAIIIGREAINLGLVSPARISYLKFLFYFLRWEGLNLKLSVLLINIYYIFKY